MEWYIHKVAILEIPQRYIKYVDKLIYLAIMLYIENFNETTNYTFHSATRPQIHPHNPFLLPRIKLK